MVTSINVGRALNQTRARLHFIKYIEILELGKL